MYSIVQCVKQRIESKEDEFLDKLIKSPRHIVVGREAFPVIVDI